MRSLLLQGVYEPTAVPAAVIEAGSSTIPAVFSERISLYETIEDWYSGHALEEIVTDAKGNPIELFPLKINPFPAIVDKHVEAFLGTKHDVLTHKASYRDGFDKKNRIWLDDFINGLLREAGAPAILADFARISNIYGGFGIRAGISNDEHAPFWEFLHPKTFFCIPAPDHIHLNEAWIVRYISASEARRLGHFTNDDDDVLIYTEHWTESYYEIHIQDQPVIMLATDKETGKNENPYGFVPFVYIPHERAGSFWGDGIVMRAIGVVRELNARFADFGDAVNRDAQRILAGSNVKRYKTEYILGGQPVVDLGSSTGINAAATPQLVSVTKGNTHTSEAMARLTSDLWALLGRITYVPPVAFGEDEGSQRSSLTLETRFWPLTSHAKTERRTWSTMLRALAAMTLKMCEIARVEKPYKPYKGWQEKDINFVWSEMLPRDDETAMRMLVDRAQNNLGSLETLLAQLPDVDNPTEEAQRVMEWMRFKAELKSQSGNTSGRAENNPTDVIPQSDKRSEADV